MMLGFIHIAIGVFLMAILMAYILGKIVGKEGK